MWAFNLCLLLWGTLETLGRALQKELEGRELTRVRAGEQWNRLRARSAWLQSPALTSYLSSPQGKMSGSETRSYTHQHPCLQLCTTGSPGCLCLKFQERHGWSCTPRNLRIFLCRPSTAVWFLFLNTQRRWFAINNKHDDPRIDLFACLFYMNGTF